MPTRFILAGPNGACKTTFYETAVAEGFINSNLPFINVDLITRGLPGMYTAENFTKADEIARDKIKRLITSMSDFMIESNLATQKDYDWIVAMIKQGYEVVLFFLCLLSLRLIPIVLRSESPKEDMTLPFLLLSIVIKWD